MKDLKISKNITIKLFVVVTFLVLMFVQIGPYLLYADENELTFSYKRIEPVVATNEYYDSSNLFFAEAYVGQNVAYCLDYGVPLPVKSGGTVKYIRTLSSVTTSAMLHGYPYVTASALGVNSDEEAILATQFAVWGVVNSTTPGDSFKTNKILDMNNLVATVGNEERLERVKSAARRIMNIALNDPYLANPTLNIENNAKAVVKGDKILVGPYKINGKGFEISSISVKLNNAPKSAQLCDANSKAKTSFKNGEDVYISLSTADQNTSLELVVDANGNHHVGKVYGTGIANDAKQDYGFLSNVPDQLTAIANINVPKLNGNIKVLKVDQYNAPLAGVTFELKNSKGKVIDTKKTDAQGIIEFSNLDLGKYSIVETSSLDGYIMMNVPVELEVTFNTTKEIKVINRKIEGGLKIIKYDEDWEKTIPNVKFQILDANKKVIDTIVTNSEGIAITNKLAAGKYYYKEISAPENIIVDSTEKEFNITDPNTTIVVKRNNYYTRGKLIISKCTEDKKPLEGVTFEIYDANKNLIDTIVTDKDGKASTKNVLKHGTYYYKEINAPDGFVVDSTMKEFTMEYKDKTLNVVNNYARGNLKIIKTGDDGKPLEGVTFEIYDSNKKVVDRITTDANGIAISKKLVLGIYTYKEVDAPDKVIMDTNEYEFKLTQNEQVLTREIENELLKMGKLKIIKTDELNKPLEGVTFKIYDANKAEVDTIVTDKKGEAFSKELVLGTYYYKEVSVPKGVIIDTNEYEFKLVQNGQVITKEIENELERGSLSIFKVDEDGNYLEGVTFTLLDEKGNELASKKTGKDGIVKFENLLPGKYNFKETDAPVTVVADKELKPIEITVDKLNVEVTVENKFAKGILQIIKTDELGNKLEGVTFDILDENKQVIQTITTNKEGMAVSKELKLGKYYYQEKTAPKGVIVDENVYDFKLTEDKQIIKREIENELERGSLSIFKVDENGNYLEDVTFTLLDEKENELASKKTGKDGIVKFENLLPGKYNFKEVDAPIYVVANKELKPIEITVDKLNVEVTVENKLAKGILKIHKTDMADNKLEGVTFKIYDSDKNELETLVTDENGMITSKELPIGKYYYQEISAKDKNVIVDTKMYSFDITENAQIITKEIKNKTVDAVFILTKVDLDNNKKVLAGAEIQVLDSNKKVIATLTTDKNGQAKLGNLKVGKYYYKEVKAPEGYILNSAEFEFEVKTKDAQVIKVTLKNEAKKLPQTGGFLSTDMLIVIIVTVVSVTGYIAVTLVVKSRKESQNK